MSQTHTPMMVVFDEVLGRKELAAMFGVRSATVDQWTRVERAIVKPAKRISGNPVWIASDAAAELAQTGRRILNPDPWRYFGLAEVAELYDLRDQQIEDYRRAGNFPPPDKIHADDYPLWEAGDQEVPLAVAAWGWRNKLTAKISRNGRQLPTVKDVQGWLNRQTNRKWLTVPAGHNT